MVLTSGAGQPALHLWASFLVKENCYRLPPSTKTLPISIPNTHRLIFNMLTDEQMRYPIGKFEAPLSYTDETIQSWINIIRDLPGKMRQATLGLTEAQLDTPYRSAGWTIRQVVHHVPDSHMNSLMRFKWAMTEDNPTIKPYDEAGFAQLADYKLAIAPSLKMLEGIHTHMVALFESFNEDDLNRTFTHPATGRTSPLKEVIGMYAWHSEHHLAHITETVKKF
jgi:hypothetical protein